MCLSFDLDTDGGIASSMALKNDTIEYDESPHDLNLSSTSDFPR